MSVKKDAKFVKMELVWSVIKVWYCITVNVCNSVQTVYLILKEFVNPVLQTVKNVMLMVVYLAYLNFYFKMILVNKNVKHPFTLVKESAYLVIKPVQTAMIFSVHLVFWILS